jgi:SAM-dependent methyltransferase
MLYEIHLPFAEAIAAAVDLDGVRRVLDVGGGSGVVSLALLRRQPELEVVVVDLPEVCAAGREIAAEAGLADRIAYQPADFMKDDLPRGFDLALECDVNIYGEALLRRIHDCLVPDGRFVVVDLLSPEAGVAPAARVMWALRGAMHDADFAGPTRPQLKGQLAAAGFTILSEEALRFAETSSAPAPSEWTVLIARA